ncbi:MAG: peptidoglycan-binding protein, partial [Eubacteriaceae bacterium]|nr:peptidoglycan-binding protein [Eubacteriaceae bacterium]
MDKKKKLAIAAIVCVLLMAIASAVYATTIKPGSADAETIKKIQTRLKSWGYYSGSVDGSYGAKTEAAVRLFQQKNGLKVDGQVGKSTFAALGLPQPTGSSGGSGSGSNASSNDSDVMMLARCINGEARGEPYEGQVAVGAVILNRVDHPEFPNSISGVVYQAGAFD